MVYKNIFKIKNNFKQNLNVNKQQSIPSKHEQRKLSSEFDKSNKSTKSNEFSLLKQ